MNADDIFKTTGEAYLSLIHLEDGLEESVSTITRSCANCPAGIIDELIIDGSSWRELVTGLVMASVQGVKNHYTSLLTGLENSGGISIIPISALISIAVRDFDCQYDRSMTDSLDRHAWDGEIGFALDWLHHTIGITARPDCGIGPNYGQSFTKHLQFYANLNGA